MDAVAGVYQISPKHVYDMCKKFNGIFGPLQFSSSKTSDLERLVWSFAYNNDDTGLPFSHNNRIRKAFCKKYKLPADISDHDLFKAIRAKNGIFAKIFEQNYAGIIHPAGRAHNEGQRVDVFADFGISSTILNFKANTETFVDLRINKLLTLKNSADLPYLSVIVNKGQDFNQGHFYDFIGLKLMDIEEGHVSELFNFFEIEDIDIKNFIFDKFLYRTEISYSCKDDSDKQHLSTQFFSVMSQIYGADASRKAELLFQLSHSFKDACSVIRNKLEHEVSVVLPEIEFS